MISATSGQVTGSGNASTSWETWTLSWNPEKNVNNDSESTEAMYAISLKHLKDSNKMKVKMYLSLLSSESLPLSRSSLFLLLSLSLILLLSSVLSVRSFFSSFFDRSFCFWEDFSFFSCSSFSNSYGQNRNESVRAGCKTMPDFLRCFNSSSLLKVKCGKLRPLIAFSHLVIISVSCCWESTALHV